MKVCIVISVLVLCGVCVPLKGVGQESNPAKTRIYSSLDVASFDNLRKKGLDVFIDGRSAEIKKLQKAANKEFEDWGYWNIVSDTANAAYILQLIVNRTGLDFFSYATVQLQAIIHDKAGNVIWVSDTYKGESNGITFFNPVADALMKLIKRGIEPEFGISNN